MEFEEIENGIKAKIPLITEEDIRVINNDFDGIVNRFSKMIIKEKDLAKVQYIIKKQQEQIKELKRNSIPTKKIEDKIKEINNKIKQNEKELRKKPEPVNSGFGSFDDYFKWKYKVIDENKLLKKEIKDIEELLEDK